MNSIFGRGPSLLLRLFFALVISVSLVLADGRFGAFTNVRYLLNTLVAPLQFAANLPSDVLDGFSKQFTARQDLLLSNERLKDEILLLRNQQLLFIHIDQENQRLRELLGSPFVRDERKMVAEVMAVDSDPYKHQVMIDKGRTNGVYEGQPVVNERGIVGQISQVGAHNSRVLLITDPTHAIPVQIMRNDIRIIAAGYGDIDNIQLENIPNSADIEPGDQLVTSGLGGIFPEGYPVARITSFSFDNRGPFALVNAKPEVQFDRLRYLLLVWPTEANKEGAPGREKLKPTKKDDKPAMSSKASSEKEKTNG